MSRFTNTMLAAACITILSACSPTADRVEITETAERSEYRPADRPNATSAERFTLPGMSAPAQQTASNANASDPFHYTVPSGWTEVPTTSTRNPNFTAGPENEIECYVTLLHGDGGGVVANVNRWRAQFNTEAYTQEAVDNLPAAPIMGHPATLVNFTGDFKGMGSAEIKSDYRIIGAIIQAPDSLITIKMIGPSSMVIGELNQFATLVDSLHVNDGHSHDSQTAEAPPLADGATLPADHPDVSSASTTTEPAPDGAGDYTWEVPEGWKKSNTGSSMRLITFVAGDNPATQAECAIFVFNGDGGGRLNNFNRWLGQFGLDPLSDAELLLQPTVFFFDEEVPLLVCEGNYGGMSGGAGKPNQMLLGASYELETESLYIKMTGPRDTVRNNWNKFMFLCASIEKKS